MQVVTVIRSNSRQFTAIRNLICANFEPFSHQGKHSLTNLEHFSTPNITPCAMGLPHSLSLQCGDQHIHGIAGMHIHINAIFYFFAGVDHSAVVATAKGIANFN